MRTFPGLVWIFAALLLPLWVVAQGHVIRNDTVWNDTEGNPVRASMGGHITQIGDTYYWVGNDPQNTLNGTDIHLYSTKTLGSDTWTHEALIRDVAPGGLGHENCTLLHCPTTGNYVIVAKSGLQFYESEQVNGPYTLKNTILRNQVGNRRNYKVGGMATFQEGDKAYVITSRRWLGAESPDRPLNHRYTGIYELTSDFLDVKREVLWLRNDNREAMWLFKKGATYYMTASHTAGWTPSDCYYRMAPSLSGPWTESDIKIGMNPATTGRLNRSHGTQHRYIMKVGEQWIFGGDRYPYHEAESYPEEEGIHILCPVVWEGDHPVVQFQSEWTIDAEVSPFNAWANLNFVENGPDKRSGDQTADEDGDGLVNLLEFALGGNPRVPDAAQVLPSVISSEGGMAFSYRRRRAADSGVSYRPQISFNLLSESWADASHLEVGAETLDDTFERVTAQLSTPSAVFLRLQVTAP